MRSLRHALAAAALAAVALALVVAGFRYFFVEPDWVRVAPKQSVLPPSLVDASHQPAEEAVGCRTCHEEIFQEWETSQHARANRLVDPIKDAAAFHSPRTYTEGMLKTSVSKEGGRYVVSQSHDGAPATRHEALAVIGVEPLIQYLAPFPGGRLQTINPAFDPVRGDWFDTFSGEPRRPDEWGFWKNQGLNWNSQCAFCHTTDFQKNYDIARDTYTSSWKAMGISCAQCHGDLSAHAKNPEAPVAKLASAAVMSNCASCHSRREETTGKFKPGNDFHDHFRLTLPDRSDVYHADGQVRDENFEYASFLLSSMGHAGVTCLDCHNPHSGKNKLPVANNALCMSCHTPPGLNGAPPIADQLAHSRHAEGSEGNSCVGCHMPQTTYMARDPRRDHGFTIPDPLLTKEHNIPNACNRCHSEQTNDWSIAHVEEWYGERMNRPTRTRARLVARARAGDESVVPDLLAFARGEKNHAWVAVFLSVLESFPGHPEVGDFVRERLNHENILVRAAATDLLPLVTPDPAALVRAMSDRSRRIRLSAAWTASQTGGALPEERRRELVAYLENQADQPSGTMRLATLAATEGRAESAKEWITRTLRMDSSSGPHTAAGHIQHRIGDLTSAVESFRAAIRKDPNSIDARYSLALLEAEQGNIPTAAHLLRETTRLDPAFARGWYNLGLAESQLGNKRAALDALAHAATADPGDAAPWYATATILLGMGDTARAREALEKALIINPELREARQLLDRLMQTPAK